MKRYTIGYYDDSITMGGTTRYLLELLNDLDREFFYPVFFALRPHAWHSELAARNVELVYLYDALIAPTTGSVTPQKTKTKRRLPQKISWWLGMAKETRELFRLFTKRPMDLLHSNNSGAEPAPIAARIARVPQVLATWHVESSYDFGQRSDYRYRFLERQCLRAQDCAIAPSQHTKDDWIRRVGFDARYATRVKVIFYGVNLNRLERRRHIDEAKRHLGIPGSMTVIGSLGRLDKAKGYEYLIRAVPDILRRAPKTLFLIAGKGQLENELKTLVEHLGLGSAVRFIGFVSDVRDLLEASDIYVQSSLVEVTPMGIIEAGAFGLPIAASNVGGIPEMIRHDESGLLFAPGQSNEIVDALVRLSGNAQFRKKLGEAARDRIASQFCPQRMCSATTDLYLQMLGASSH